MADEKPPLSKKQRRPRRRAWDQARRRGSARSAGAARAENADAAAAPHVPPVPRRGRPKRRDITAADVTGLKCFEKLAPLLERPLSDADRANGVLSDQIVRFPNGKADARPDHPIRLVGIQCSPHTSRGKYGGGSSGVDSDGVLRIATNLLDAPVPVSSSWLSRMCHAEALASSRAC